MRDRGEIRKPEGPSVDKVGNPPWLLEAPDLGEYTDEEANLVTAIKWHGMWFIREGFVK